MDDCVGRKDIGADHTVPVLYSASGVCVRLQMYVRSVRQKKILSHDGQGFRG
jgi:hypothetical protein